MLKRQRYRKRLKYHPFDVLPRDMWGEIFLRTDPRTTWMCSLACKHFKKLIHEDKYMFKRLEVSFSEKKSSVRLTPHAVELAMLTRPDKPESVDVSQFFLWLKGRVPTNPFTHVHFHLSASTRSDPPPGIDRILSMLCRYKYASPETLKVTADLTSNSGRWGALLGSQSLAHLVRPLISNPFVGFVSVDSWSAFKDHHALRRLLSDCADAALPLQRARLVQEVRGGPPDPHTETTFSFETALDLPRPLTSLRELKLELFCARDVDFSLDCLDSITGLQSIAITFNRRHSYVRIGNLRLMPRETAAPPVLHRLETLTLHSVRLNALEVAAFLSFELCAAQLPNLAELNLSLHVDDFALAPHPAPLEGAYELVNVSTALSELRPLPPFPKLRHLTLSLLCDLSKAALQPPADLEALPPSPLIDLAAAAKRPSICTAYVSLPADFLSGLTSSLTSLNLASFTAKTAPGFQRLETTVHATDALLPLKSSLKELRIASYYDSISFLDLEPKCCPYPEAFDFGVFPELQSLALFGFVRSTKFLLPPGWDAADAEVSLTPLDNLKPEYYFDRLTHTCGFGLERLPRVSHLPVFDERAVASDFLFPRPVAKCNIVPEDCLESDEDF